MHGEVVFGTTETQHDQTSTNVARSRPYLSEMIGTALLVFVGLSLVIFMFGTGSPMARLIPAR